MPTTKKKAKLNAGKWWRKSFPISRRFWETMDLISRLESKNRRNPKKFFQLYLNKWNVEHFLSECVSHFRNFCSFYIVIANTVNRLFCLRTFLLNKISSHFVYDELVHIDYFWWMGHHHESMEQFGERAYFHYCRFSLTKKIVFTVLSQIHLPQLYISHIK